MNTVSHCVCEICLHACHSMPVLLCPVNDSTSDCPPTTDRQLARGAISLRPGDSPDYLTLDRCTVLIC